MMEIASQLAQERFVAPSDRQLLLAFCLICAVFVIVVRLVTAARNATRENQFRTRSRPPCVVALDAKEYEVHRAKLAEMIARSVDVRIGAFPRETTLIGDLRIPPAYLYGLVEDLQEYFGIAINEEKIRTVGDLCDLIQPPPGDAGSPP